MWEPRHSLCTSSLAICRQIRAPQQALQTSIHSMSEPPTKRLRPPQQEHTPSISLSESSPLPSTSSSSSINPSTSASSLKKTELMKGKSEEVKWSAARCDVRVDAVWNKARTGLLSLPHGDVPIPVFMYVDYMPAYLSQPCPRRALCFSFSLFWWRPSRCLNC